MKTLVAFLLLTLTLNALCIGVFAQDTFSPIPDLHISLGLRYDRYKLLIEESALSPRIGVAYHVPASTPIDGAHLLACADRALYCAKASGRNTYQLQMSGEEMVLSE